MIIMPYQFMYSYRTDKSDFQTNLSTKKKHISYLIMPSNPHDILYPLSVPDTYLLIKSKEEEKKIGDNNNSDVINQIYFDAIRSYKYLTGVTKLILYKYQELRCDIRPIILSYTLIHLIYSSTASILCVYAEIQQF